MAYWFTGSVAWTAVNAWAATNAYTAGTVVRQLATPTVGAERVFVCIIAGTSLSGEPTWVTTKGATTAEAAGPTWMECTGQPGVNGSLTYSPNWTSVKNTTPALGYVIQNNSGTYLFIVTTSGLTGNGAEPSWNLTAGVTTTDNAATWTCLGVVGGFGTRAAPFARLQSAVASGWGAAGDTFWIDDNHAETQAVAMTITSPATNTAGGQCYFYCVDHTVANPGSANLKTTATISTTGSSFIQISQGGHYYGVTFNLGSGANNPTFGISSLNGRLRFENCALNKLATTGITSAFTFNSGAATNFVELVNTTVQFGAITDALYIGHGGRVVWRNTPSAITGATLSSNLFNAASSVGTFELYGVDLSAQVNKNLMGTANGCLSVILTNCKLASGYVIGTPAAPGARIDIINSDSGGTNYNSARSEVVGSHIPSTTLVRTNGAPDVTTPISWQVATAASTNWVDFFESMPIMINNAVLSTNRVVTLHGIWNSASLPNNDQIWIYVEYLGSSSTPISSSATNTKANNLATGTALTADSTSAWDSQASSRVNSNNYSVLGTVIKVPDNPGRVFFCTATGVAASSEPAGYASAVDGGSVTDGAATFRAGTRFLLTVTLSSPQPAMAGYIRAYIRAGGASQTFWVDPWLPPLG